MEEKKEEQYVEIIINGHSVIFDLEDYLKFKHKNIRVFYRDSKHYIYVYIGGKSAAKAILNPPKGSKLCVDHINRNPLDNRKSNLRLCTISENSRNRGLLKSNKLGVRGVSIAPGNRYSKPYRARIRVNDKLIHLGYFATIEEASQARKKAEKYYFGDFAPID